ncbi:MAG: HAD hydrolase family protein [Phycisphaerales bacterium]|nr:HAD hydrolase family protein [Phycisphaerales bacterium]
MTEPRTRTARPPTPPIGLHPRYDLLALDLDGTLLSPSAGVSQRNVEAVLAARRAGIDVVVCTGRGLAECRPILDLIQQVQPIVVAGGSILACPVTGSTLHRFPMDLALVTSVVHLLVSHGHAALVLKDAHAVGYDYLVVCDDPLSKVDPVTSWWFKNLGVKVRFISTLDEDEHPEHTVRVGVCGTHARTEAVALELRDAFGDRTVLHHFPAVAPAVTAAITGIESDPIVILEAFDRLVSKWTAIQWLAAQRGIPESRIAAIGDQINDVPMIRHAALGIAMGNAIPDVRSLAKKVTLDNASDGVAHAIDHILAGRW